MGPDGPSDAEDLGLAEIAELPMVAAPRDVAYDRMLSSQLHRYGVTSLNVVIRLGHADAIKQTAIDHGWACLIPGYAIADDVAAGRMQAVPVRDARLSEGITLYHRTTKFFSPLQRAAVEAVENGHPAQEHIRTGRVLNDGKISDG